MNKIDKSNDKFDIIELLSFLISGKKQILAIISLFALICTIYLHTTTPKYSVKISLKPVLDDSSNKFGSLSSGLGSLSSLAGLSLSKEGTSEFRSLNVLLLSEDIAQRLMSNKPLIKEIFSNEWNEEQQKFKPSFGIKYKITSGIKFILLNKENNYVAPNASRLSGFISSFLKISSDLQTGYLNLVFEHQNPKLIVKLLMALTKETDLFLKERYVSSGKGAIEYYKSNYEKTQSQVHKEALLKLIISTEQKLMLAHIDGPYSFEIILGPTISLRPTSPKRERSFFLSILLAIFLGSTYVLIRRLNKY